MLMTLPGSTGNTPRQVDLKLRENFQRGVVVLFVDDVPVKSDREYRGIATYVQRTYRLTDDALMELYQDYREDYDRACDEA
jgi:predicted GTPase